MSATRYENESAERLKELLRAKLNERPMDMESIRSINVELAARPEEKETQDAWERFLCRFIQPLP